MFQSMWKEYKWALYTIYYGKIVSINLELNRVVPWLANLLLSAFK